MHVSAKAAALSLLAACATGLAFGWGTLSAAQPTASRAPTTQTVPVQEGASLLQASTAQPVVGPIPFWVAPVALPAPTSDGREGPVRMLLQDQQVYLEAGRQTSYTEMALRFQTPAGLAAGNISLPWRPESDVLTIHKLQILRGQEVIDVLASGQSFTVLRREQNLENAMLDGVLTANIQPEGLRVGDVLVVAASTSTTDPVLGDHVEVAGAGWNFAPIARAHLSVQWPESLHVDHRLTPALPPVRLVRRAGMVRFDLSVDDVEPIPPPNGAPTRFAIARIAAFTTFSSWADLARLMAPLYERAATLPADSRVMAEAARIRDLSPDPIMRAEAALTLVQDRVRYVALAMGQGGLVPVDAETTWARRFGDCKGKTALLLALLHALDIEAEPVAVSSVLGDGLDQRLPMVSLFDHVLVRATIAGRAYWLDGTRIGDTRLAQLQTPNLGWGLPLVSQGAALVRMAPAPLETPDRIAAVTIDARAGLATPATIHAEFTLRGDDAVIGNLYYSSLSGDERDRTLRDYWRRQYDDLEITSATVAFDPDTREQRFVMDGRHRMDWSRGRYAPSGVDVGYRADFTRDPGPNRDAPFAVPFPYYRQAMLTILLPRGQGAFQIVGGDDVDQIVAGISYRRRTAIEGDSFRVEVDERSVASEFSAADAPAAQATLRALGDRVVNLVRPPQTQTAAANLPPAPSSSEPLPGFGPYRFGMSPDEARAADPDLQRFGPQLGASIGLASENGRAFGSINLTPFLAFPAGVLAQLRYQGAAPVRDADECALIFALVVGVLEREIGPLDGPPAGNEYGAPLPLQTIGASRIRFYAFQNGNVERRGHANRRGAHSVEAAAGVVARPDGALFCAVSIDFRNEPLPELVPIYEGLEPPTPDQLARARRIENPVWVETPAPGMFRQTAPTSFSTPRLDDARVALDCLVIEGGRLNCTIASENPPGFYFGEVAMRLSRSYRIAAEQDGQPTLGGRVHLPAPGDFWFSVSASSDPQVVGERLGTEDFEALRVAAASAPSAAELDAAPLIAQANWIERPDGPAFARYYPTDALVRGLSGSVTLSCLVLDDGHLRCAVTEEDPADAEFGLAALGIAQSFRMAPEIDGIPTAGRRVVLPIRFRLG